MNKILILLLYISALKSTFPCPKDPVAYINFLNEWALNAISHDSSIKCTPSGSCPFTKMPPLSIYGKNWSYLGFNGGDCLYGQKNTT